jgi:hypothetical protein
LFLEFNQSLFIADNAISILVNEAEYNLEDIAVWNGFEKFCLIDHILPSAISEDPNRLEEFHYSLRGQYNGLVSFIRPTRDGCYDGEEN